MFRSVREQIFSLPDSCFHYPRSRLSRADGYQCRRGAPLQPRLSGEIGEGDFTGYMKNLRLAHPKKMDVAVPANIKCGRARDRPRCDRGSDLGAAQIFICRHLGDRPARDRGACRGRQILNVREPGEFEEPVGGMRKAVLIPLGELAERAGELACDRPIVAACQAGSRSAQATVILREPGSAMSPISPAECCAGAPKAIPSKVAVLSRARFRRCETSLLSVCRFRCYPLPFTLIAPFKFVDLLRRRFERN